MWRRSLLVLAACGSADAPLPPPVATPVAPPSAPAANISPQAQPIRRVAITDEGDAAVSADGIGVRLWPRLDGTAEPRAIRAAVGKQLAIAHAGPDLLVAVLDQAGGLELQRFGPDGALHGHGSVPPEPAIAQIAALGDGVLALGTDQVVRWYRADGALRGSLSAPGRLSAIATRRGAAIALDERGTHVLPIELAPLRWGAAIELPEPLRAPSLSPDHAHVAGISHGDGVVYALAPELHVAGAASLVAPAEAPVWSGFTSDASCVFASPGRFGAWGVAIDAHGRGATQLVAGDHRAIAPAGTSLAIVEAPAERYLGYGLIASEAAPMTGVPFALHGPDRLAWVDDELKLQRRAPRVDSHEAFQAIDARFYLTTTPQGFALADLRSGHEAPIGGYRDMGGLRYDPSSRVLGIQITNADGTVALRRVHIADDGAMTDLPALRAPLLSAFGFQPLDPKRAGGAIGVSVVAERGTSLATYRDGDDKPKLRRIDAGMMLAVTADGSAWVREGEHLIIYRGDEPARKLALPASGGLSVPSPDGAWVVVSDGNDVSLVDAHDGRARWTRKVFDVGAVAWRADATRLLVQTGAGTLVLDAATGAIHATACAWEFGFSAEPQLAGFAGETLCE